MRCLDITTKLHLVSRDNACNIVAGREMQKFQVLTAWHTLCSFVINEGVIAQECVEELLSRCHKIVGLYRKNLVFLCIDQPVQDEPTQWNSSYYMLSLISEQKQAYHVNG